MPDTVPHGTRFVLGGLIAGPTRLDGSGVEEPKTEDGSHSSDIATIVLKTGVPKKAGTTLICIIRSGSSFGS